MQGNKYVCVVCMRGWMNMCMGTNMHGDEHMRSRHGRGPGGASLDLYVVLQVKSSRKRVSRCSQPK